MSTQHVLSSSRQNSPTDNMFLRFEEGAAIRIQSLMPRSNAMHLFRPTDSFPSGATHTTLASASASALLLVAPTGNADANSMLEAYAPIDERLRSWEASHRIHTGRMRKSTRAAVNCGARACSTLVWYHTAQVQECSAGASRPAPQRHSQYVRHGCGPLRHWRYMSAKAV